MDGARHVLATEHLDRPFDLPPMAEMEEVAERPAPVRAARRLVPRMLAEKVDQVGRLGQRGAILHMNMMSHGALVAHRPFSNCPIAVLNGAFTIMAGARRRRVRWGRQP